MIGATLGGLFGLGVLLVGAAIRPKSLTLESRVSTWAGQRNSAHFSNIAVGSPIPALVAWLDRSLGGSRSVSRRLQRLNSSLSVVDFRSQQVVAGCLGLLLGLTVALMLSATSSPSAYVAVFLAVGGFVLGVVGRDQYLSHQVIEHDRRISQEFPTIAELLALAVAAGEPPTAALERVVRVSHGELASQLQEIVNDIRMGARFVDAFDALAARTGVTAIARFSEALSIAVERGTPLTDVLHAQAADVRETARRALIELAARKEIAMMLPVVFLLLPVTVLIAFYPGFIGLSFDS